jgi:hypothetical protein
MALDHCLHVDIVEYMNARIIRAAAKRANQMAKLAWKTGGDCAAFRRALAEYTRLCGEYAELTGRMLML